jgi:predicted CopG family antitoxin
MTSRYAKEDENKINHRVTIALDNECYNILKDMKTDTNISQSEIFRNALKFYKKYGELFEKHENLEEKLNIYLDMLTDGEHLILDVDHYLSILKFIKDSPDSPELQEFWNAHREIGKNHAEQFKENVRSFDAVVKRLEACNFFKLIKDKENSNRYTLLLGSNIPKEFIKTFLLEVLNGMGFNIEIKESFAKLKIYLNNQII